MRRHFIIELDDDEDDEDGAEGKEDEEDEEEKKGMSSRRGPPRAPSGEYDEAHGQGIRRMAAGPMAHAVAQRVKEHGPSDIGVDVDTNVIWEW